MLDVCCMHHLPYVDNTDLLLLCIAALFGVDGDKGGWSWAGGWVIRAVAVVHYQMQAHCY